MLAFGKFYFIILAFIFLQDLRNGNWRAMVLCNVIPALFVGVGAYMLLDLGPRRYLALGQVDEALNIIDRMGQTNKLRKWRSLTKYEV